MYSKNIHKIIFPASLTKLMTALLLIDKSSPLPITRNSYSLFLDANFKNKFVEKHKQNAQKWDLLHFTTKDENL